MAKPVLIGCAIFQEEVEHIVAQEGLELEIRWLEEVGLHERLEELQEFLEQQVESSKKKGGESPALLFGTCCLPDMLDVAKKLSVPVLSTRNCLSAMVGDSELKELERNRTMVATPGWVRKMWLGRVGTTLGWTADDYRMQFGRYDRILVLDSGINPLTDEEIITCYDLVEVPIEVQAFDLGYFRELILQLVAEAQKPV